MRCGKIKVYSWGSPLKNGKMLADYGGECFPEEERAAGDLPNVLGQTEPEPLLLFSKLPAQTLPNISLGIPLDSSIPSRRDHITRILFLLPFTGLPFSD